MTTSQYRFKFQDIPIAWAPLDIDHPPTVYDDYAVNIEKHILHAGKLAGLCNISGVPTEFIIAHHNLRETLGSVITHSNNRQRQLTCAISIGLFGHPQATVEEIAYYINLHNLKLYTAEANGALYTALKKQLRPDLFYYSEYFGPAYAPGELVNGIRHEDLQRISFPDESFDIILTAEVFEHIPDALIAEREVVRILKKGGLYCFTVPFMPFAEHDSIRASLDANGQIIYHAPPEYHGDPVRPEEGSLVYRVFSQHDMEERYASLGCEFTTYALWSRLLGILGQNMMIHIVKKLPRRVFEPMPVQGPY